jgi:hypothetical protein
MSAMPGRAESAQPRCRREWGSSDGSGTTLLTEMALESHTSAVPPEP